MGKQQTRSKQAAALKTDGDLQHPWQTGDMPHQAFLLQDDALQAAAFPHGWVLNVGCQNKTNYPIKSYTAEWIVPSPPLANGQLFFIFIGITNPDTLIQCMLQWGKTPCGGGQSWSIGCTQVKGDTPTCRQGNLPVAAGDTVRAAIVMTGNAGQNYNYRLQISNGVNTVTMDCDPLFAPRDCCVALESYTIESGAEYPPDKYTLIDNIQIDTTAGAMPVQWVDRSMQNPDGQHVAIANIDRIALWFHGLPSNPNDLT
jgi:hypothetical protein